MKWFTILCFAALCASCSPAKTEKSESQAPAESQAGVALQAEADAAQATDAEESKAEAPAEPKAESWPAPKTAPQLPELKSDYWPAPADGYFPVPLYKGKPVPLKKGTCSPDEDNTVLGCSFGGKYSELVDSYGKQLVDAGFEAIPESDLYVKRMEGEPVRTVSMVIGDGDLYMNLGSSVSGANFYSNRPDSRIPYPLKDKAQAIQYADTFEIIGNGEPVRTYIFNADFYNPALFEDEYGKRLENSGFKKAESYPLYVSKAEDGTFLSVVIEPKCYTMTVVRRDNESCISMTKSRLAPVDAADPIGLYKNLPDSSIPYPNDGSMALKYRLRSDDNGTVSFVYGNKEGLNSDVINKDIAAAYEARLAEAGFKMDASEKSQNSDMDIETKKYIKLSGDGKSMTITIVYESLKDDKDTSGHYKLMTIKMAKQ